MFVGSHSLRRCEGRGWGGGHLFTHDSTNIMAFVTRLRRKTRCWEAENRELCCEDEAVAEGDPGLTRPREIYGHAGTAEAGRDPRA